MDLYLFVKTSKSFFSENMRDAVQIIIHRLRLLQNRLVPLYLHILYLHLIRRWTKFDKSMQQKFPDKIFGWQGKYEYKKFEYKPNLFYLSSCQHLLFEKDHKQSACEHRVMIITFKTKNANLIKLNKLLVFRYIFPR